MKSVLCFGEALIDMLNSGNENQDGLRINHYLQFPGGAPANVAVALAKLGGKAYFAGQVGNDMFGDYLEKSLKHYGVGTRFLSRHPSAKTALAFVFLDDEGERSFSFYRDQTADVLLRTEDIHPQWFTDNHVFHFCSNTLTDQAISDVTTSAVKQANGQGLLVSFDVNLRYNLWPDNKVNIQRVNQLVEQSQLLKFSADELEYLSEGNSKAYIQKLRQDNGRLILVTNGGADIQIYTSDLELSLSVPEVNVIDTTGGGDCFTAGVLYAISVIADFQDVIADPLRLTSLIRFASFCGAKAVSAQGAFPAFPTFSQVNQYWSL